MMLKRTRDLLTGDGGGVRGCIIQLKQYTWNEAGYELCTMYEFSTLEGRCDLSSGGYQLISHIIWTPFV